MEFKAALNRKYLCPRKTFAKFAKSRKKTQDNLLPTVFREEIFLSIFQENREGQVDT